MEKRMIVTGMMCKHCEARVKKALEALQGVESAAPDHEKNEVLVKLNETVSNEILIQTVTDAGYVVKECV